MTWIPLAVCALVLLTYARSLMPKPPATGECIFCAAQIHASPADHQADVAAAAPSGQERLSA